MQYRVLQIFLALSELYFIIVTYAAHHGPRAASFSESSLQPMSISGVARSQIRHKLALVVTAAASTVSFSAAVNAVTGSSVTGPDSVVVDKTGLFGLCTDVSLLSSCVSSQDDRPAFFMSPWCYEGGYQLAKTRLLEKVLEIPGASITNVRTMNTDRFVAVEFSDEKRGTIDDAEFFFTPNDNTVQFRSIRRGNTYDFGVNRRRIENLRIALRFDSVPVLRNRRRILLFIESPFDTFGPATIELEKRIDEISGDMSASTHSSYYPSVAAQKRISFEPSNTDKIVSTPISHMSKFTTTSHAAKDLSSGNPLIDVDINDYRYPSSSDESRSAHRQAAGVSRRSYPAAGCGKGVIGEIDPATSPIWASATYRSINI